MKELPQELLIAGLRIFLFMKKEEPLMDEEPEFAEFLAAFGTEISNYAPGRLRELYLGRSLARVAIRKVLGADPGWLRAGAERKPELPHGVAASLTHTHLHGHRIALVGAARTTEKVIGVDLEPCFTDLQAEKLRTRFSGYFDSGTELDAKTMTELFTIYEASVKILSQKNRGIVSPSHLKLTAKNADSWVVTHPESGTKIEGIVLPFGGASLSIGVA